MARTFQGYNKQVQSLYDRLATSDATLGENVAVAGYTKAWVYCSGGLVATGDSDDLVTFTVQKNSSTTTAASDFTDITASATIIGPSADTDTPLGIEFIDLDLVKHGMTDGVLRVNATGSLGISASISAGVVLYRPMGRHSDTSMTFISPASS